MKRGFAIAACGLLLSAGVALGADTKSPAAASADTTAAKPSSGRPLAPEFGPSVQFDKNDVPVTLADLRGKTVFMVFYQSW